MKRRQERVERAIKVYVLSKAVQKSFIFRTVLLSGSITMEDVWTAPLTYSCKWISEGADL